MIYGTTAAGPTCDATASGAESATVRVLTIAGGEILLCQHHANLHAPELLAVGATVASLNEPPDPPDATPVPALVGV